MAYFTIDRAKINPEWDAQTKLLYLWLCEEAAFAPHEWRGVMVKEGQYLTTLRSLAEVFNTTKDTIKRRLKILESFQSVKVLSIKAKDGRLGCQLLTLITLQKQFLSETNDATNDATKTRQINNYNTTSCEVFKNTYETNEKTNNATTISEYNNYITSFSSPTYAHAHTHECTHTHEGGTADEAAEICRDLVKTIRTDQTSQYSIQSRSGISPYAAIEYVRDFANDLQMNGGTKEKETGRKLVMHFTNWLVIRLRQEARKAAEDKRNKKLSSNGDPRQAARETAEALQRDFFQKYGGGAPTFDGIGTTGDHLPNGGGFR